MTNKLLTFLCVLMIAACSSNSQAPRTQPAHTKMQVSDLNPKIQEKYFSTPNACYNPESCGDIVSLDCGAEVDGDYLYINNTTAKVIMRCGGACAPEFSHKGINCGSCPPKEWKCEK
ncbi:MAG TPA: hypothetical protein PK002_01605 [Cellvibrio sp.]|nr:hypothetical protein [Cellvibrio sp.]